MHVDFALGVTATAARGAESFGRFDGRERLVPEHDHFAGSLPQVVGELAEALLAGARLRPARYPDDVQVGGVNVERGQKIAALLGSANRDPAVFPDAHVLDVGRADNPHISFGAGVHFCIGAPLARVELQASFGALLHRTSRLELGGPARRRPEFVIRCLRELPRVLTA